MFRVSLLVSELLPGSQDFKRVMEDAERDQAVPVSSSHGHARHEVSKPANTEK